MTNPFGQDPPGATPLDDDDLVGLIPSFVATRADLNLVEQANIEEAARWALRTRVPSSVDADLSVSFAIELHRRMFRDVWRWAGHPRTSGKNIGVDPAQIMTELKLTLDDGLYWHAHQTYPAPELAVRLHHRLVRVHPFRNGNGRHSRLMADIYLHNVGAKALPWGAGQDLVIDSTARRTYIDALHDADRGDMRALLGFATS